ncbi:ABC transporter ATP-binding protein [Imhoffiella purpurea]|uniref:Iron(III) dicitrate transport ATP-binding protein n=1 Tax=Imhoffiella purpurea TaxID=1249627 RepID=W9VDI7_9GAMM|nr:ABC transporter ATP-binding protein [Imhoffiella purpurea]EXJ14107.1 Iron(III) dicitrate transport ATP-binding protein [Imhoffiella purpurea]
MLEIRDLALGHGPRTLVRGLDLEVPAGGLLAVLGPNGAGKSTLLKALAHLLQPRSGSLRLDGEPLAALGRAARARRVAYLSQQSRPVAVSVYEAILLGRIPHLGWQVEETDLKAVDAILAHLDLSRLAGRPCTQLSGGELQKVLIGRALAQTPRLLLLDEPVNHLDLANQLEVLALIRRTARDRDLVTLVVLHDLNLALRFADRFLLLDGAGGFVAGDMASLSPEQVEQVYRVPVTRCDLSGQALFIPR